MTAVDEVPATKKARIEPNVPVQALKGEQAQQNVQQSIQSIEEIEDELNQIEDKQSEAIIKLEQEFVKQKTPHYTKRAEQIKKIPHFWQKACMQHPQLYCLIEGEDEKALAHLTEIYIDQISRDSAATNQFGEAVTKTLNFAITFRFSENEYFENAEITKSFYQMQEDVISESTPIKWKEGKDLTAPKVDEANGDAGALGEPHTESFFCWFGDHSDAENDETADVIKEDLYLHALNYYLNEDDSEEEDEEDDDKEEIDLNSDEE